MTNQTKRNLNYLFKASWGGTSLKFWIEAPNPAAARTKAENYVMKMEGRYTVIDLDLLTPLKECEYDC